jgi:16S rRNA processing protein RimM
MPEGCMAFTVEGFRADRNSHLIKLRGIDSQAAAEALRGRELLAAEADFLPPEEGRFYTFQVIGSSVVTVEGKRIGEVTAVVPVGDGELLVVSGPGTEVYVPFRSGICVAVDPERREIVIDPPEGLLDLNEI